MPITDSEGNPINVDNLDDISTPSATEGAVDSEGNPIVETPANVDPPVDTPPVDGVDPPADPPAPEVDLSTDPEVDPVDFTPPEPTGDEAVYSGLADILSKRGVISETEDPITTEEQFIEHFTAEIDAKVDERVKKVEEYMNSGIPFQEVSRIQNAINQASAITEEDLANEDISSKLIIGEMTQKGMSVEQATEYFELVRDAGKMGEKATEALESRKEVLSTLLEDKVAEVKAARADEMQAKADQAGELAKSIDKGEVLGKKLSPRTIEKLKSTLNTVVAKHPETGEPMNAYMKFKLENPVDFEKNVLYLYTLTEGFTNLKSFERSAETQISRKFKDAVASMSAPSKSFTDGGSNTPSRMTIDPETIDDIVDP